MSQTDKMGRQSTRRYDRNGLESKHAEKERFFALAVKLIETSNPAERQRLKHKLARMTFGE